MPPTRGWTRRRHASSEALAWSGERERRSAELGRSLGQLSAHRCTAVPCTAVSYSRVRYTSSIRTKRQPRPSRRLGRHIMLPSCFNVHFNFYFKDQASFQCIQYCVTYIQPYFRRRTRQASEIRVQGGKRSNCANFNHTDFYRLTSHGVSAAPITSRYL